jgi:hypothetical protein
MRLFQSKPRIGIILLGAWLIATGILNLVPRVNFSGSGEILAGLAIAASVLLLLDRPGGLKGAIEAEAAGLQAHFLR